MGQQQFIQLRQTISEIQNIHSQIKPSTSDYLISILKQFSQQSQNTFTTEEIQFHILNYLNTQIIPENIPRKRSRSYQLLQMEQPPAEDDKPKPQEIKKQSKTLEQRMEWLEQIESKVRKNITQLMVTQQTYKIRQTYRKLALHLLNLQNFLVYILHPQGRLQFHDFKNNYITDVIENQKTKSVEEIINQYSNQETNPQILNVFDLSEEINENQNLNKWGVLKDNKLTLCFLWKIKKNKDTSTMNKKIAEKLADIAMISTAQQEISIIQLYSKDLLELLQLCINQYEQVICKELGSSHSSLEQTEKQMLSRNERDDALVTRINVYQQIQFELLERIRLYKKYVCEDNKIFMDFNEEAELTFCSHNFTHPLTYNLPKLFDQQNLVLQKIFENYKPISDFLKKAVQQKLKNNKLYQLDFQAKARVKYNSTGKITRLNVILQELQNSSNSSSSNIYCSSSTKILSQDQEKRSLKDLPGFVQVDKTDRKSTLIRTLEKQNPGITNQGWINLFIKDHHMSGHTRKNTHLKSKAGKSYTVKRSFSLDQQNFIQSNDPKNKAMNINVESIDLNLLQMDEEILEPLVLRVFRKLEYFHSDHVHKQSFDNFLSQIHKGYQMHDNPFHNFTHGVNVMHTCYLLSHTVKIKQILSPFKIFSVVFSGLCHDVGHTGFTNLFQIASRSKKAITYNDNSPLQNYHAAYTFQLLKKPENNFLKDISTEDLKDFRKSVINNILFTDIKEHFPLLKKFNSLIKDQLPKNEQYLNILTAMIVHTSDFGGSAKQFEICKSWSLKVNLQFSNQYRMEGQLGLPQTPFMKDLNNVTILSKNQSGFLKVIVFPLYEGLDEYCGTDLRMRKLREYVETNIRRWQQINLQSQKEQKKELILENKKE